MQHGTGLSLIDAAAEQDDRLGSGFLRGGTVGGSHAHEDKDRQHGGDAEGEEGEDDDLDAVGTLFPQAREEKHYCQHQQNGRRPEHTDVAHAHGEGEEEVHSPQEAQCAEDG